MDPSWNDENGVVLVVLIRGRPCHNSAVIEGPGHISRRSGEMPGVGTRSPKCGENGQLLMRCAKTLVSWVHQNNLLNIYI